INKICSKKLVIIIILISLSIFSLISFVSTLIAIIFVFIHSFLAGVAGILANNEINKETKSHNRATVLSILNFLQKMIYAIVAPFIGYITDIYTLEITFLMIGILLTIYFIILLFNFKKL
ncbi:MAG: MFS transporter, partial [Candidatus Woesearchaeota archaeon]